MVALTLGLLGVAGSDLVAGPAQRLTSSRPGRARALQAGAGLLVLLAAGWALGLASGGDSAGEGGSGGGDGSSATLLAMLAGVLVVLAWQAAGLLAEARPWVPLAVLSVGLTTLLLLGGLGSGHGGPLAAWLAWVQLPGLQGVGADRVLLLLALGLAQLSTANVVVRLVLRQVDMNPPATDDQDALQGGRVLGPMERLLILGLGLAGQVTAASIVIAAKGLIRWPELSRSRNPAPATTEPFAQDPVPPSIHDVTEYFLVGSFVSWLVALGSLVLAHLG